MSKIGDYIFKIKLKEKGSSGGHNGLKNIELHLSTKDYKRIKIGVEGKLIPNVSYLFNY